MCNPACRLQPSLPLSLGHQPQSRRCVPCLKDVEGLWLPCKKAASCEVQQLILTTFVVDILVKYDFG